MRDAAISMLLQLLIVVADPKASPPQLPAADAEQAADALSFFLPGIAVGLCKALLLASTNTAGGGQAPPGPASSSAAAAAAMRALVVLLTTCLGDAVVEPALLGSGQSVDSSSASGWQDTHMSEGSLAADGNQALHQALEQLQTLAHQVRGSRCSGDSANDLQPVGKPEQQQQQQQPSHMRVVRSAGWVQETATRLHGVLSSALPRLLMHPRPAVRQAAVEGGAMLTCELPGA